MKRIQPWQYLACGAVVAYLAAGAATGTIQIYHWLMLMLVPFILLAAHPARNFLIGWSPMLAFWLVYDRLRLLQPWLLARVAVDWPCGLEKRLFGWLGGGDVPAHTWRLWMADHTVGILGSATSLATQLIYASHLFVLPVVLLVLWIRRRNELRDFERYVRAFTLLHVMAIATYLMMPVAPPWWVSIHGTTQPDGGLVARTDLRAAMDGAIVQHLISSASQWFAAVPSLHAAYPVMFVLLAGRNATWRLRALIVSYGVAMWVSTVALNQHYFIDLFAGMIAALLAFWLAKNSYDFFAPVNIIRDARPKREGL